MAFRVALKYCEENGVLSDFLPMHATEVENMLTTEFDMKRAQAVWRHEALEEGFEIGFKIGFEIGFEIGIEKAARGMIGENLPLEQAARITGLSIERVRELAQDSDHGHADGD